MSNMIQKDNLSGDRIAALEERIAILEKKLAAMQASTAVPGKTEKENKSDPAPKNSKPLRAKRENIQIVADKTGWSFDEAKTHIEKTMNALRITSAEYIAQGLYKTVDGISPAKQDVDNKKKDNGQTATCGDPELKQLSSHPEKPKQERKTQSKPKNEQAVSGSSAKRIPDTPHGPKISGIYKEGIEYYWKKVEIADGYEVLRSYSPDGPYEPIVLIEKRSIGTYIDAGFDRQKKEVFYTVRSYVCNPDGTKTFSETIKPVAAAFRENLELERTATYMYSGSTRTTRAFFGWGEINDPRWSSSDENVATVSTDGVISAHTTGSCTITCTSAQIDQTADMLVVVNRQACEPLSEINARFQFNAASGYWENKNASCNGEAVIMMVGDMMCGKLQMTKQYTEERGWDFSDSFNYVKEITSCCDLAVGNLETLLAAGWPYMTDETYINNMNNCNATSRYLDAIRYGGFDAVVMANNHNCDGGTKALMETIDQVERYQLARTGVFRNVEENRFFIANVNGIKVGYLSYISKDIGFNEKDVSFTAQEKNMLLNVFMPEKAKRDIAACRAAGAEYIIVYMHWGFKNFRNVAKHQTEEAQAVADAGADYIVGSNPHVVQKYEIIRTKDQRDVPCAYSIGNFQAVMNQVPGNRDSVLLRIQLRRNESGSVVLTDNAYIPCHTYSRLGNSLWAPVAVNRSFHTKIKKKDEKTIYQRILKAIGPSIKEFTIK